jgi:hypothetical protein
MQPRIKLRAGIILLIVSQLLGWGALAFVCSLAFKGGKPAICLFGGIGLYAVSWGGFGLGVMLAGTEAILYVCNFLKKRVIASSLRFKGPLEGGTP